MQEILFELKTKQKQFICLCKFPLKIKNIIQFLYLIKHKIIEMVIKRNANICFRLRIDLVVESN